MNPLFRSTFLAWLALPLTSVALGIMPLDTSAAAIVNDTRLPIEATADLYSRISARDLDGVLQYVPAEGFTEVGIGAGETHRLDRHAFEAFFKGEHTISLRAADLAAQELGDTIIVTGMRVGSITPKGQQAKENRALFTMVWARTDGRWLLRHVHLSAVDPGSPVR
jgi:ketosteroid isomerase-like protein